MKLTLLFILCLLSLACGSAIRITHAPFVRSRYSLRWRKTTTATATTDQDMEAITSTEQPRITSTASADYDYGEVDNVVHS